MKNDSHYGYCLISITTVAPGGLLQSNNERAFIISQLQDLLSPRLILGDVPPYRQLASCIDLLAFSIRRNKLQLLVFSVDTTITADFAHRIVARLFQYRADYGSPWGRITPDARVHQRQLSGPHGALHTSVLMHRYHEDWEYDRYSSIGFYLHDRRGDWMRTWRLARLYSYNPELYRELLKAHASTQQASTESAERLASSPHG